MDSFDLSEQRIVQLEQIPDDIRCQIEKGDGAEYALDLSLNRLRSIDHIGVFEHVSQVQLDLSGNQLESINGIQTLRRLQSLDLSRNCIASVDLLALLPALQILKVAENSLTAIDSLQLLPELRVVDASYNRITKWPPLAGLILLETLDLSDNMLGAFSSSVSATLFPSRLRRLSIARNQIDKICGIACLGLQLPVLEFLAFDGNPIVLELARTGGQLERLIAAFFPCLPLSNDGGLTISGRTHEEFATPPHTLNTLKHAILEGNENILEEFLVTGSLTSQENFAEAGEVFPPPPPVERPLLNRHENPQTEPDNPLSHDNKLEIWKRIQEDRKTQSSGFTPSDSEAKREKSVRWGEHAVVSTPLEHDVRKPALTTADLAVPAQVMPALDVSSLSVMKPLDSTFSASTEPFQNSSPPDSTEYEALVKKLTDQVTTMRKYMKIWIKREKMVRDASVRKIQRWIRRVQRRFQLRQRVLRSRSRRQDAYSFRHCSSTLAILRGAAQARLQDASAQIIQCLARGFIVRRRTVRFKQKRSAACKIQRAWRKNLLDRQEFLQDKWKRPSAVSHSQQLHVRWDTILRTMIRWSRDVKQLQQVCAVQDEAISSLWGNQMGREPADKAKIEKNVVRFQLESLDKPERSDISTDIYPASVVNEMKSQIDRQSLEIDQLKQQVQTAELVVSEHSFSSLGNVLLTTQFASKALLASAIMGNISSCYKNTKQEPCTPATNDDNQAVKSEPNYKPQAEEEVDRPVILNMPKETPPTRDNTSTVNPTRCLRLPLRC
ncbi:Leucine-rich repeat domain, L domain-like [Phytophthora cactorum]|nr:Leucine-rich repeat domain, L domain-like [Phytophthora cactorum]